MSVDAAAVWREAVGGVPGRWSLRAVGEGVDLDEAAGLDHPAASIIKLPILHTVLDLVETGQIGLEERVTVPGRVGGAGALRHLDLETITLGQALSLMITISDNMATNAVIEHVGMSHIQQAWRAEGRDGFRLNRLLGVVPRSPEEDNRATADAAVRCLLDLDQRVQAGSESARFGLSLLADQQFRDRIPSRLPDDVECLNKTGELAGTRHDVGLLRRGGRTLAVAMLASDLVGVGASSGGGPAAEAMGRCAGALAARCL